MTLDSKKTIYKNLKSVLVAEDDPDLQELLKIKVENTGLRCEVAGDGVAAFEKLQTGDFDLLITDFRMPKMDGVELLKKCRENKIHIPVIFQSSDANLATHEQIALADCCATLMFKPVNHQIFLAALGAADNRSHHLDCMHSRETPVK